MEDHPELVTVLPMWSVHFACCSDNYRAVLLYRSSVNSCSHRGGRDRCDLSGIFLEVQSEDSPRPLLLCPRHWYAIHYDPHPVYKLLDMTNEEYAAELGKIVRGEQPRHQE